MNYSLISSDPARGVLRSDGWTIPPDPANADYREYLAWLNAGNTPEPAPEPPAPGPDYLAFWDALMVSTVYASIREQSFTSLPMNTLATEFIALIGDAKAGRPNEAAIQASINAILVTGTFTEDHLIELAGALAAGNLDGVYVLPVPEPQPEPQPEPTPEPEPAPEV